MVAFLVFHREKRIMAKVTGPLFSQEASGQFAKTAVFARRRGQNVVRAYVIPSNPRSAAQIIVRISLAATGIVTRRVNATKWTYAGQTSSWIEFLRTLTRTGEVWNSAFVRLMQGPGRATYIAALAQYTALDAGVQTAWDTAAETAITDLEPYVRDGTTVTTGFMLFLAERTIAAAGYGETFDPAVPFDVIAQP